LSEFDLAKQIRVYIGSEQRVYETYSHFLINFLELYKKQHHLDCEVSGRTKAPISFAEKCIRKGEKYNDPVYQLTDLCGVRIVVKTQTEVRRFSRFIESAFIVDEANSENKLDLFRENEFGYLSVHFIVQVPDNISDRLSFALPADLKALLTTINGPKVGAREPFFRKAEIQVRTLLQHQWADSFHDRIYKNAIQLPRNYRREANQLAAVMESADKAYTELREKIDAFVYDLGAFMDAQKLKGEIEILRQMLGLVVTDEDKGKIALRMAKLARAGRDWETVCGNKPYLEKAVGPTARELSCEVAIGLCRTAAIKDDQWVQGKKFLKEIAAPATLTEEDKAICELEGQDLRLLAVKLAKSRGEETARDIVRARAMAAYAWIVKRERSGHTYLRICRDLLYQAHLLDPSDPIAFSRFIDAQLKINDKQDFCNLMWSSIEKAIDRCRELVAAGAEVTQSLFAMARLYLCTDRTHEALMALVKAIARCAHPAELLEELEMTDELHEIVRNPVFKKEVGKARLLLLIGIMSKDKDRKLLSKEEGRFPLKAVHNLPEDKPVLIIAGGTDPNYQTIYEEYRLCIWAALDRFSGVVFSGGTNAGIPGIVGDEFLKIDGGSRRYRLLALLPQNMKCHPAYDVKPTDRDSISHLDMLQYWADILAAGISPQTVKFLGINGGMFSEFEYALATALGATTGILEKSGRKAEEFFKDPILASLPTSIPLPKDAMTIQAFVTVSKADIARTELELKDGQVVFLEPMARKVHANYVNSATVKPLPWDKEKNEDFKRSCFHQVVYTLNAITGYGLTIGKLDKSNPKLIIDLKTVLDRAALDHLAQMEHGRWNVERLLMGWRYDKKKDVAQRRSPYLTDWDSVPADIQKYDYDPWINLPVTLAEIGLGIYKE
jgi:ppGpp synthetase/RelA/SpoT-type nucleotidyltranferase